MSNQENSQTNYKKKVWISVGVAALVVVLLLILKELFPVLLFILAATLISLLFLGVSRIIQRKTKWNKTVSLVLAFGIIILCFALSSWFIGARLQEQVVGLTEQLPAAMDVAKQKIRELPLGDKIMNNLSSPDTMAKLKSFSGTLLTGFLGGAGNLYVILFIAVFITVNPTVYKDGFISLLPKKAKSEGREILDEAAAELSKWIKGKLFAMVVVFVFTALGLWAIGTPMPLALALIAAILIYIPNFGPIISALPAIIVALPMGNNVALMVAGLYVLIQFIESNFLTPLVQEKLVKIPPALIITAQVAMGFLTGILGLLLATPIVILLMIVLRKTYIEEETEEEEIDKENASTKKEG